ncbi:sensor domain-containing diguanylate cyclase [Bowmanella yangjiangensis]|uniref:diguanylate cyclase n=1 Tax=Bowmanella yangjiangensis TaxID=2811230 RepID=A0ABS3CUU2_9ALTE|nr:GGDEF domain-containing protein [Bowmanella yangjiangensis]MBN7820863.1 GGDEF domain-containing protein [Bowmanella yangjiangensis]
MRTATVIFLLLCFSLHSYANSDSSKGFESRLSGVEKLVYALPEKANAELAQMEEEQLVVNQPEDLLVRYYLAKATINFLLQDYPQSQAAAEQGLAIATKDSSEALQLNLKVIQALLYTGQSEHAARQLDDILQLAQASGDLLVEAEALLTKGIHLNNQGALKSSYAAIMSSLEAAEASGHEEVTGRAAFALGQLLLKLNGFERSQVMLQEAQHFFESRKMSFSQMLAQLDIAELHEKQQQREEAIDAYQSALTLARVLGDGRYRFRINLLLAGLYHELRQQHLMQQHMQLAEELQHREKLPFYIAKFQLLKAQSLLDRNALSELVSYLDETLPHILSATTNYRAQVELLKLAAEVYAAQGDYQKAFENFSTYHQQYVNLNSQEHLQDMARQQVLFDLERLEYENHNLNWKNVLQRMEIEEAQATVSGMAQAMVWLSLGVVSLLLMSLWIYRSRVKWGRLARIDTLTGLYNRRYLTEWYHRHFSKEGRLLVSRQLAGNLARIADFWKSERAHRAESHNPGGWDGQQTGKFVGDALAQAGQASFTLILADIDYFKNINDTYGHETGDKVLTLVADVFRANVRSSDVVARVGGEEFMVMLPSTDYESGLRIAENLRAKVAETPLMLDDGTQVQITSSFGVLTSNPSEKDFTSLCSKADELLYAAKAQGRNCVVSLQAI